MAIFQAKSLTEFMRIYEIVPEMAAPRKYSHTPAPDIKILAHVCHVANWLNTIDQAMKTM